MDHSVSVRKGHLDQCHPSLKVTSISQLVSPFSLDQTVSSFPERHLDQTVLSFLERHLGHSVTVTLY